LAVFATFQKNGAEANKAARRAGPSMAASSRRTQNRAKTREAVTPLPLQRREKINHGLL
jgi:hypothetical protein